MRPILSIAAVGALLLAGATVPVWADQQTGGGPLEIGGVVWEWVALTTPQDRIEVEAPDHYSMEIAQDGTVALQVDCNRGVSHLTFEGEDGIAFGPVATTMMACPEESLAHQFTSALEAVERFRIEEGELVLELADEAGTMHFKPAQV